LLFTTFFRFGSIETEAMDQAIVAAQRFMDRNDDSEPDERGHVLAGRFRIVRRQKRGDPDAETGLIQIQFQVAQVIVPHLPGEGC
jgi:hypothetical protein